MTEVVPQDHKRSVKKNAVIKTVYICNDTELADQHAELQEELQMLEFRMRQDDPPEQVVQRFDEVKRLEEELRKLVRENSIRFRLRSIGRAAFEKLVDAHPATDETRRKLKEAGAAEDALNWDPDTFAPVLLKAAIVEPEDFDVDEAWNSPDWNQAELASLFSAAVDANTGRRIVPLGNA